MPTPDQSPTGVADAAAEPVLAAIAATAAPTFATLPYNPFRRGLYTVDELMTGYDAGADEPLATTTDGAIYAHQAWFRRNHVPLPVLEALAQRIHDHAVDDALHDFLGHHPRVVAVMGGHALQRGDPTYRKVAQLGRSLAKAGYLVATGGGPGAMEAANLGAWLAPHDDAALDEASAMLAPHPDYRTGGYLGAGDEVRRAFPSEHASLAVPTWFYGHEPTNQFATHVAKYFANSIREDGLLAIARHGVVYAPGAAGTTQEVFQDATQNHYNVFGVVSPMVLLGTEHWTEHGRLPVLPLLTALAQSADNPYDDFITCVDEAADAVRFIVDHPPR